MRTLLATLVLAALPVQAHHSTATNFTQEIIEISGTIEQIRFQNPHTSFVVKTEAAPGQAPYWLVESDARSTFQRKGVDLGAVAAGSQVKVSGRKGVRPNTLFLRDMALEDGTVFTSSGTGRD
jgi:hypothetical protein